MTNPVIIESDGVTVSSANPLPTSPPAGSVTDYYVSRAEAEILTAEADGANTAIGGGFNGLLALVQ